MAEYEPLAWWEIARVLDDVDEDDLAAATDELVENGSLSFSDDGVYLDE